MRKGRADAKNNDVTWYRMPWSQRDVAIAIGPAVFHGTIMSTPFLIGMVAPLLFENATWGGALISCGVILVIALVTYWNVWQSITLVRQFVALGIGVDASHVHIDQSLWRYGQRVTSIPRTDVRRLNLVRAPKYFPSASPKWFRLVGRAVHGSATCILLDYNDRVQKVLFQPIGLATSLRDLRALLEELASQKGMLFRVEGEDVSRELWLESAFQTLLEVGSTYERRIMWWWVLSR